jgi:hypothetical protein
VTYRRRRWEAIAEALHLDLARGKAFKLVSAGGLSLQARAICGCGVAASTVSDEPAISRLEVMIEICARVEDARGSG